MCEPAGTVRNQNIYTRLQYQMNIVQRIEHRLCYFGHVARMDPTRYPKVAMEGYVHGQISRGRPKKRWMDMIEDDCEMLGLNINDDGRLAQDRAEKCCGGAVNAYECIATTLTLPFRN